jgi:uncharacterized membrane protein
MDCVTRVKKAASRLLLAYSFIYIAGSFGLTMVGNVPLNERLAKFDASKPQAMKLLKLEQGLKNHGIACILFVR